MDELRVARLADAETVSFGPASHYRPLLGADDGSMSVRTGIQVAEPGYAAAVHSHPYMEILLILEGEAEAWIDGREEEKVRLGPGDSVAIPANVPHSFRTAGDRPMKLLGTHLSPSRIVNYKDRETDARGYPAPQS